MLFESSQGWNLGFADLELTEEMLDMDGKESDTLQGYLYLRAYQEQVVSLVSHTGFRETQRRARFKHSPSERKAAKTII
ncbi:hypothetical protein GBAR_LOCUS20375 [Geodia barretti]|uniref:Uncharacterized protein n=1 Tax=Geodia barretti TaxID=519541 RepID=A0AA35SUF2_GEOBA|nr:hypothetical protein GBAR_LOCUS20375 [Geodia barretti]